MSLRVMTAVFHTSEATANDRLVLLAIADEADDDGTSAFPSLARLGEKARIPVRTVRRCIERLEALGELEVDRPERRGRGRFNNYRVTLQEIGHFDNPEPPENWHKVAQSGAPLPNPSQTLRPLDPKSKSKPRASDFDAFWVAYPRHAAKPAARKAWDKATRSTDPAVIVAGAERYAAEFRASGKELGFVPYPQKWLNQVQWNDEPIPPPTMPANGHRPSPVERGLATLARTARALEDQENGQPPSRQHSRPDAIDVDATRAD